MQQGQRTNNEPASGEWNAKQYIFPGLAGG